MAFQATQDANGVVYNGGGGATSPYDGVQGHLAAIPQASKLGVIFELWISQEWAGSSYSQEEGSFGGKNNNGEEWSNSWAGSYPRTKNVTAYRHNQTTNVLFADAHVANRKRNSNTNDAPIDVIWYWQNGVAQGD